VDWPLRFGIFLAPFHPVGQNPTLALERDLELVVRLDQLGFDEAWFGEHHSAGYEFIASPEVFIAVAAERSSTAASSSRATQGGSHCAMPASSYVRTATLGSR
jgi:alkanesulfonate monooxygenase SsuD/methylene tetrahydromethanopterin reductase-like flavin-dependent oxidoreductase (luciferase family)